MTTPVQKPKYTIVTWTFTQTKEIDKYSIVDSEVYPDNSSEFLKGQPEWYRKERLDNMLLVSFKVSPHQSAKEARRRADEYCKYMNDQWDQMQVAAKLVQL